MHPYLSRTCIFSLDYQSDCKYYSHISPTFRWLCLYVYYHWIYRLLSLVKVKWSEFAQSCLTLCDPMDCSPPGSSLHGILQARVLEWIAVSFSRGSSQPRDRTRVSLITGRRFNLWATREAQWLPNVGLLGNWTSLPLQCVLLALWKRLGTQPFSFYCADLDLTYHCGGCNHLSLQ